MRKTISGKKLSERKLRDKFLNDSSIILWEWEKRVKDNKKDQEKILKETYKERKKDLGW